MDRYLALARRAAVALLVALAAPALAAPQKVLRIPFIIAETNFDPAFASDTYSYNVIDEIIEPPLTYDMLARPYRLKVQTAESMPEITEGGRVYTVKLKKGIYFADDPAFNGKKRELVAKDYEFAIKRLIDPAVRSPNSWMVDGRIEGIDAAAEKAKKDGKLDYDAPISGIRLLDSHTLQLRLAKPDYNFLYILAMATLGGQAREVVERYGNDIGAHPVGTGPFLLKEWKRSHRIVLEKNPNFREMYYDEKPTPGDALSERLLAEMKGKRIPQLDRIEISVIEESQPRWLAFLNNELDWINLPYEFKSMALANDKPAPWVEKRGIKFLPSIDSDVTYLYYNMKDPVLGGYTPEKVALRRAISLAYDIEEEVNLIRNGTAIEAQTPLPPGILGYDANFNMGRTYDPAKAKALLDMFGYVDKDGDGWREQPDGKPLLIEKATSPDQQTRQLDDLMQRSMTALGIKIDFKVAKWPENLKASRAGKLMVWNVGWSAATPDGDTFLALGYGPNKGQANHARFDLPAFNALYEKQRALPDSPERRAAMDEAKKLMIAYMPYKVHVHRTFTDMAHPWVVGYHRNIFVRDFW